MPLNGNGYRLGEDVTLYGAQHWSLQAGYNTVRGTSDKASAANVKLTLQF